MLYIQKYNESYIHITGEQAEELELSDHLSFLVNGYRFMPAYRNRVWDGRIRLFDRKTGLLYAGLLEAVLKFADDRKYDVDINYSQFAKNDFSLIEAKQFITSLNLSLTPREDQIEAFVKSIRDYRTTLLSPTGSGKSLIAYLICKYLSKKTLIIVPTTGLIHQLAGDFKDYGYTEDVHKIFSGQEKDTDSLFTISTWQSLYKMPKKWFNKFEVVIGDEAHTCKAESLKKIMTNLDRCKYRIGMTGTLSGTAVDERVIVGLFGPVFEVSKTHELIDQDVLSPFLIKCIVLHYNDETKKKVKGSKYQDEIEFIVSNEKRNKFIQNLVLSLKGNTLVLFRFIKHGKLLYDMIQKMTDRKVFLIYGNVDGKVRDEYRKFVDENKDCILIASVDTTSTGINIKSLENIIFTSPSKARIKILQAIGRVLRKSDRKDQATLYDIADNLVWKRKKNFTINHFLKRVDIYSEEKHKYKLYNVILEK